MTPRQFRDLVSGSLVQNASTLLVYRVRERLSDGHVVAVQLTTGFTTILNDPLDWLWTDRIAHDVSPMIEGLNHRTSEIMSQEVSAVHYEDTGSSVEGLDNAAQRIVAEVILPLLSTHQPPEQGEE